MLIAWFSVVVFVVGSVLHFAAPWKWAGYGTALVTGSTAGLCIGMAGRVLRIL
jgi:hypothetical protein